MGGRWGRAGIKWPVSTRSRRPGAAPCLALLTAAPSSMFSTVHVIVGCHSPLCQNSVVARTGTAAREQHDAHDTGGPPHTARRGQRFAHATTPRT